MQENSHSHAPQTASLDTDKRQRPDNQKASQKSLGSRIFSVIFIGFLFFVLFGFSALGVWQVQRLGWKENLIAQVNARTHLAPIPAPQKQDWSKVNAANNDYRPVFIKGRFLPNKEILVKASVLLNILDESGGAGYWVMTPLKSDDGAITYINRGFIPMGQEDGKLRQQNLPQGEIKITGLLRMSEGAGILFNKNDPKNHIWYKRQLSAFAKQQDFALNNVAPYFIDADATANPTGWPRGGLTKVQFPNNHLAYAITWFSGAIGALIALILIFRGKRQEKQQRQKS